MSHLSTAQLVAYRDHDEERALVIGHLAVCDACGARFAALVRERPAEEGPRVLDSSDFIERGYRVRGATPRWTWVAAAAGIAALVVLAITIPRHALVDRTGAAGSPSAATRGGTVHLIEPRDRARTPLTFRWTSPVSAASFKIE